MTINQSATRLSTTIMATWIAFLLGTLFHTQLALMPLFHGLSVTESHAHAYADLDSIFWFMLVFFCLPLGFIVLTAFHHSLAYRRLHFGLTLLYSLLNTMHLIADIIVAAPAYQLVLMVLLLVFGLFLNRLAYQWMTLPIPRSQSLLVSK